MSVKLQCKTANYLGPGYFFSNSFSFQIAATASTIITLSESQQQTFILANYISSSTGYCSMYSNSVDSCQILKYGSTTPYLISSALSSSKTTFNFIFDITQIQSDNFQLYCTLSNGLTFSNIFSIQVIKCIPSITVSSSYSQTITTATAPFSVFTATSSDTYSFCSRQSFALFGSNGLIASSTTSTYSFNTATGEFKIISFTGYYNENFYVQVTNQYTNAPIQTASIKSQQINILYQVDCTPSITIPPLSIIQRIGIKVAVPYSVFSASTYSTINPTYCKFISYTLLQSDGTTDISSLATDQIFDTTTGEFKIAAFQGTSGTQYFTNSFILRVNSNYKSGTNSAIKFAQTSSFTIDFKQSTVVTCTPSFSSASISNFNGLGYVTSLTTPLKVFMVSQFSPATTFPLYCVLSYSLYDSSGSTPISSSSIMSFDSITGEFDITAFTNNIFEQTIRIKITSTYQESINSITTEQIKIRQVYCFPQITIGDQIQSLNSLTPPYQVFKAQDLSSIQNSYSPTYCSLTSYILHDSTGLNTLPTTQAPYSFDTNTGEFIITSFNGYFYLQVIVQVNGIYQPTSSLISTKSQVITIKYVVCAPTISGLGNIQNQVYSLVTPFTAFTASTYFSTFYPCSLTYKIFSYPTGTEITSSTTPFQFLQPSGLFQVTSYTNNMFEQNIKIEVTASYSTSSASLTTDQILIRQVYCLPSINGLSSLFNYSINVITSPHTVFKASDYASTANPTYCTLSYKIFNQDGSNIVPSQNMIINSQTGQFQVSGYNNYPQLYFGSNIILQVTSSYSQDRSTGKSINQTININIYTCYPIIYNSFIQQNYTFTVDLLASLYNPQLILIFYANAITTTASDDIACYLTYKTFFANGTEATLSNSQFANTNMYFGLALTDNKGFSEAYYFQATATSLNPPYSNKVKSNSFTINVKPDPAGASNQMNHFVFYSKQLFFPNFISNANVTEARLPACQCKNQTTKIIMGEFNPNFLVDYEPVETIKINFTSFNTNNTKCQINDYQILPYSNKSYPAFLSKISNQASNKYQFFDFNLRNTKLGQVYTFQIMVTAAVEQGQQCDFEGKYGGEDFQKITFDAQITAKRNCQNDKINQIQTMPLKNESYFNSYKSLKDYPVLFLNISQEESIIVDISSRFKNDYPECLLSYKLSEIIKNGQALDMTPLSSFISLTSKGIFKVNKQSNYQFNNYQAFVQATNEANVKSIMNGYLIDLSVYQVQILKTRNYKVIKKPQPKYDPFLQQRKTKLSKKQACTGLISTVNNQGLVKIIFTDIINTNFNISWINDTNTQMYVKPAQNRDENEGFDLSSVNFTWSVKSFIKDTMFVKLDFNQPLEISTLIMQDQLIVNFNGSQELITCINKNTSLNSAYSIMLRNIPPQIANSNDLEQIGQVASLFADTPVWLLAVGTVIVLIGFGNIKYMVIYIRTQQLIVMLTSIQIVFPANTMNYLKDIRKIVSYDILAYFNMYSLPILNKIQFDSEAINPLNNQMQDLGYDNRNAMQGLGTFTYVIVIYFLRIFFEYLMKIICKLLGGRFYSQQIYDFISYELSLNPLLSMSIEGFFDFMIFGYLNMITAEFTSNGEILGFIFGIFSLLFSGIILPIALIVALIVFYKYKLSKEDFENKWEALFEMVITKNNSTRIYMLVFYIRRMIILASLYYALKKTNSNDNHSSLILVFTCVANYIYSLYIGSTKPLERRQLNNLEIFNEFFVASSAFFVMIISDWAGSQIQKYFNGFAFIFLIVIHSCSNVLVILMKTFNNVILVFTKVYNLCRSYQNKRERAQIPQDQKENIRIKLKNIHKKLNAARQQISVNDENDQNKKQRQTEIFDKILEKQNQKLSNIDLAYQAYQAKIKKNSYSSIYAVQPIKKIVEPDKQNQDKYILQLNQTPVIAKMQDSVDEKFLALYNKYEFLFVTDEDQFRIKEKYKMDYFDFLDSYIFNSQDQKLNLLRKSHFLVNYVKSNVKLMKNEMKQKGIKNPDLEIINFQDELFNFINENYILCLKLDKKEYLQFIM